MTQLPTSWVESTVGDIFRVVGGGTPSTAIPSNWNGEIPWISSADISDRGAITFRKAIPKKAIDQSAANLVPNGSVIVVTRVGLGKVATAPYDMTFSQDCQALLPVDGIEPEFLRLQLSRTALGLKSAGRGTTISGVTKKQLLSLPVAIPPISEQERIVAAIEEQFSRLDAGVAGLQQARRKIALMRAATYESATSGLLGEEAPRVRLADVLREPLRNGHSAKTDPDGTIPILKLTAITFGDFGSHNLKMTAADPQRVHDLWIQPGDLLIERSNSQELVGTACLYRGTPNYAVYPDLVIRARVNDSIMPEYAELVFKAPRTRRYFQQRAQGISGSMPKIDQRAIEGLSFTLPSREKQIAIVQETERKLTLLASLDAALELAARRSSTLRSSILEAAFSGRLVAQDPSDGSASELVERIAAERASLNGHRATRARKPLVPRKKVDA